MIAWLYDNKYEKNTMMKLYGMKTNMISNTTHGLYDNKHE